MRSLLPLLLAALCSCAGTPGRAAPETPSFRPVDDVASTAGARSTFSFGPVEMPPASFRMSTHYQTVRTMVPRLVAEALQARGYQFVEASADIVVTFGAGRREVAWPSPLGYQGGDDDYVQGTLVVDAFAASDRRHVWHGEIVVPIDPDRVDRARLRVVVERVLATFPSAGDTVR